MENKVKLKRHIIINFLSIIIFLIILIGINFYEYHSYTVNFNYKINSIVTVVKEKYPDVTEKELIEILNSDNSIKLDLQKYGIDLTKESIVMENDKEFVKFIMINIGYFIIFIGLLVILFLKFENKKDKEIKEITKYIEEINRKNYKLDIDSISEDELSILKNEIYKTTIMLKEQAENSMIDKINLKNSLSDISHQLKTPLTSILVILDNLIEDANMQQDIREDFIRDIKREIMNINFLVQSLLKLSKFETNTINFITQQVDVKNIIDESIKNVASLSDLKDISIEVKCDNKKKIKCDFKWQVEAITNILKNAVEHSLKGSKVIIECEENNIYSSIKIKNFGKGIDKEDLPHIFERFYKGKNASKESIGIGLALAKTIIENDNGNISVESEQSKETVFTIKYLRNI